MLKIAFKQLKLPNCIFKAINFIFNFQNKVAQNLKDLFQKEANIDFYFLVFRSQFFYDVHMHKTLSHIFIIYVHESSES